MATPWNKKIEYFLFLLFGIIAKSVGVRGQNIIGKCFGGFLFHFIPIRKKIVIGNLKKAFPEYSNEQILRVAKRNYIHFATLLFEIMGMTRLTKSKIKQQLQFSNLDRVLKRRQEDKAVFFMTAHFGNWELGGAAIGAWLNEQIYVLAKPQSNKLISDWLNRNREYFGNKVVPLGASVREIYQCVKEKGVVGVVGDQRGPESSDRVLFMGIPTAVYTGTAAIALKTGTPIFTSFPVKNSDNTYKADLQEIDMENLTGTDAEKIKYIMQRYMDILSNHVKANPEQWFWMHNIWKY